MTGLTEMMYDIWERARLGGVIFDGRYCICEKDLRAIIVLNGYGPRNTGAVIDALGVMGRVRDLSYRSYGCGQGDGWDMRLGYASGWYSTGTAVPIGSEAVRGACSEEFRARALSAWPCIVRTARSRAGDSAPLKADEWDILEGLSHFGFRFEDVYNAIGILMGTGRLAEPAWERTEDGRYKMLYPIPPEAEAEAE